MSPTSTTLVNLPPETLERIFMNLIEDDPDQNPLPTLNTLIRTCKKFSILVKNSTAIWKDAARNRARLLHWESELRSHSPSPKILALEPCAMEKKFLLRYFEAKEMMRSEFLEPEHGHCPVRDRVHDPAFDSSILLSDANMNYRVDLLANYYLEISKVDKWMKTSANMHMPEIQSASSSIFTLWRNFLLTSPSIYELRRELRRDPDKIPLLVMFDVSCKDVYESRKVVIIDNPKPPPDLSDDLVEVLQSEGDSSRGWCIVAKFIIGTFYVVDVPKCELLHTMNIACFPRFKFHVEHRPYFREATSIITGPPDNSDHSFNMINLFLDIESPGGVGWTAIRPTDATLHCYAMDINKRGHAVALFQDGSRQPFLGSWPRKAEHETSSRPKKLFSFDSPFRTSAHGWNGAYQVRVSHELNIAVCFISKTGMEAEVIGMKLSCNFDTASMLFRLPRKSGTEMLAVSSRHFALAQEVHERRVDILDVRNGAVLKTFETPKCPSCEYNDEMPLGMFISEKRLWINWSEHPTLHLRFS